MGVSQTAHWIVHFCLHLSVSLPNFKKSCWQLVAVQNQYKSFDDSCTWASRPIRNRRKKNSFSQNTINTPKKFRLAFMEKKILSQLLIIFHCFWTHYFVGWVWAFFLHCATQYKFMKHAFMKVMKFSVDFFIKKNTKKSFCLN